MLAYRGPVTRQRLAVLGGCAVLALSGCAATTATAQRQVALPAPSGAATTPTTGTTAASPTPVDAGTPDPTTPAPTSRAPSSSSSAPRPSAVTGIVARGLVEPSGAAVRAGTFALGDSFLLGSTRVLTAAHVRVDAKVGRQFFEGIPELRAVARSGTLPRNLLVHLGTNGTILPKHCDNVVATAGPSRRVFFVTVIGPRSWMAPNDRVLKACAARHHQQVVIVDWAAVSASHPNWFGPDRVHPNPTGRKQYNALILSALKTYGV